MAVTIKSQREIELMRESCKILADVFSEMEKAVHPGVSTLDINNLGEKLIRAHGCIPNFLNYNGYPASICVSVNDEVVHGIPHKDHGLDCQRHTGLKLQSTSMLCEVGDLGILM